MHLFHLVSFIVPLCASMWRLRGGIILYCVKIATRYIVQSLLRQSIAGV
jgi:hypothetical protein